MGIITRILSELTSNNQLMANNIYTNAVDRLIGRFKADFLEFSRDQYTGSTGRLIHPGEFGGF